MMDMKPMSVTGYSCGLVVRLAVRTGSGEWQYQLLR